MKLPDPETYPLLSKVTDPAGLRKLSVEDLTVLAKEVRSFLLHTVSQTSGHLASGLGVVELTIALHYVYNTPFDNLVWDVGHQAYPHKILTGRAGFMDTIRKLWGLHSFPWRGESPYDTASVGHASTSIGIALGMAVAADREGLGRKTCAVIGDGAMTGGMAFEALNHAGSLGESLLVVLNDNEMSISEPVGALSKYLSYILSNANYNSIVRSGKNFLKNFPFLQRIAIKGHEYLKGMILPGTLFEELGFNYVGPVNGHDPEALVTTLRNMRNLPGPQLLHVVTRKGMGYEPAENDPTKYHGVPKFSLDEGVSSSSRETYASVFGRFLCESAEKDPGFCAITPAMCEGSGMKDFSEKYPKQFFDVAIAEQHAVTFAAGLAAGGMKPVVCVYSTFLQRAYDQIVHDVALPDLPVVIAVDHAGIVGPDGPTHQGVFDISFLLPIPNMVIMAPGLIGDFRPMLDAALSYARPVAVRYPKGPGNERSAESEALLEARKMLGIEPLKAEGSAASLESSGADGSGAPGSDGLSEFRKGASGVPAETIGIIEDRLRKEIHFARARIVRIGKAGADTAILAFGALLPFAMAAGKGTGAFVVDMRFIKPLDEELLRALVDAGVRYFVTAEDGVETGGIGEHAARLLGSISDDVKVRTIALPDEFIRQGTSDELYRLYGLDSAGILLKTEEFVRKERSLRRIRDEAAKEPHGENHQEIRHDAPKSGAGGARPRERAREHA